MPSSVHVKICGLRKPADVAAAAEAGARYIGFVFFGKSPRNLDVPEAAQLALSVPVGVCKVALTVNASDAFLDQITAAVPLDMLQLHGTESVSRVAEVKARYGLPVMKALGVADQTDLAALDLYSRVADQILVDTKPPKDSSLPGGNGVAFDWNVIAGRRWSVPWMLAGGLTKENVAEAVRVTGTRQVDLSSAVETAPGEKDAQLIRNFCAAVGPQ